MSLLLITFFYTSELFLYFSYTANGINFCKTIDGAKALIELIINIPGLKARANNVRTFIPIEV